MRFCMGYRNLNNVTMKDVYPQPRTDDTLDWPPRANFYPSMDLSKGYWQIEVNELDRLKTTLIAPDGLYKVQVMPFGYRTAR